MDTEIKSKVIVVIGIMFAVLIMSLMANNTIEDITSATVAGQTKCVGARAALKFINEKNCTRIFEDSKCEEQGLVEVQC